MSNYNYTISTGTVNGAVATDSLTIEIRKTAIVTALSAVSVLGDTVTVTFKASLSAGDETILDAVIAAHEGIPVEEVPKQEILEKLDGGGRTKQDFGFRFTVPAGTTYSYDYKFTETCHPQGGFFYTENHDIMDYMSWSVVDVDNTLGYGAGFVLTTYRTEVGIDPTGITKCLHYRVSDLDMKNFYMRVTYTSAGATDVKCNCTVIGIGAPV